MFLGVIFLLPVKLMRNMAHDPLSFRAFTGMKCSFGAFPGIKCSLLKKLKHSPWLISRLLSAQSFNQIRDRSTYVLTL